MATPLYYAHCHLDLRQREAEALAARLTELNGQKAELEATRRRGEAERDAKFQELAADTTQQSIQRIESQMEAANERLKNRQQRWMEFAGHLKTLKRPQPVESEEEFARVRGEVEQQKGLLEGNRSATDEKRVKLRMEQEEALGQRGEIAGQLESLRKYQVLIPSDFVAVREAVGAAAGIPVEDLPFAGELMEVKPEFQVWTGAMEHLLHSFGVSLLVPERHYVPVARFINEQHLGIRFAFHKVPGQSPILIFARPRWNWRD